MTPGILLIGIVAGAYLAAHVASEWLARRHRIVSGAEYLLLGALLGPGVTGVLEASPVDGFAPFLTLAFGWVGALVGVQFHLPELRRLPLAPFGIAFAQALLAGAAIAAAMGGLFVWALGVEPERALAPALALGAIGVSSAPAGIAVVAREVRTRGPLLRQLHVATAVDALTAIVVFGLAFGEGRAATGFAVGLIGGLLFHLFLGREKHVDRLFVALAGALILTSGAAAYLRISPLLPSFLVGLVLVNTSPSRSEIRQALSRVERPLYFVLLIFAGAAWRLQASEGLWVALAFLCARVVAKVLAARAATTLLGARRALGTEWGWGLIGHGGLAVALALDLRMAGDSTLAGYAFTAVLLSIVVTDVASARVVGSLVAARSPKPASTRGGPP